MAQQVSSQQVPQLVSGSTMVNTIQASNEAAIKNRLDSKLKNPEFVERLDSGAQNRDNSQIGRGPAQQNSNLMAVTSQPTISKDVTQKTEQDINILENNASKEMPNPAQDQGNRALFIKPRGRAQLEERMITPTEITEGP